MKNILILGANSYVGFYLSQSLGNKYQVMAISRQSIPELSQIKLIIGDSLDPAFLISVISENKIDTVINCVCIGNVDQCEKEKSLAFKINFSHVESLVGLSKQFGFKLIHFSSNAVYDGDHPRYNEESVKSPKNYYGEVKALADEYIKKNLNDYLLVRVMTLYGNKKDFHRHNPATMIIKSLQENKPIKLVNDLFNNLLFIDDLVNFIKMALEKNLSGEFNLSGDEIVSRYEFGLLIGEAMNLPLSLISSCSSDEFPSLTLRAYNTSFDNSKVKALSGNIITPLKVGIKNTVTRMQNADH